MLHSLFTQDVLTLPNVITIFAPILIYYIYSRYLGKTPFNVPKYVTTSQSPNEGSKFDSLDDIMKEKYLEDKNHIYKVEHPHKDVVIMPAKYVDELILSPPAIPLPKRKSKFRHCV